VPVPNSRPSGQAEAFMKRINWARGIDGPCSREDCGNAKLAVSKPLGDGSRGDAADFRDLAGGQTLMDPRLFPLSLASITDGRPASAVSSCLSSTIGGRRFAITARPAPGLHRDGSLKPVSGLDFV